MDDFSFVHASDLHLDSPFKGITDQLSMMADALQSATFDAYDNLIKFCIDKKVHFLVIAGDVYDGADRSIRAQLKFLDGLKKLANHNISVYIAHGNHDPLDGWSSTIEWPDNVYIFKANEVKSFTVQIKGKPIAAISGISYKQRSERRNLAEKFNANHPDLFQIAVLHCNCGRNPNYDDYSPCRLEDLTRKGFDYWALGHVHERQILNSTPYIVYSGNTQGRNIKEDGARGCYLTHVRDGGSSLNLEFYQLNAITWLSKSITIETIDTLDGLDRAISQIIVDCREEARGRPVIYRLELSGRGPLYAELKRENAIRELLERARQGGLLEEPFVCLQKIKMNCSPEINLEKRRKLDDLLGQVLQEAEQLRNLTRIEYKEPQTLDYIPNSALGELYLNSRVGKALDPLSHELLQEILYRAELLCIDLLEPEG